VGDGCAREKRRRRRRKMVGFRWNYEIDGAQ
jgi:hypothetical protein